MYIFIISTHKFCLQKKERKKNSRAFGLTLARNSHTPLPSVTTWTPFLSFSITHTITRTHTDAGKACRRKHTLIHTHTHTQRCLCRARR